MITNEKLISIENELSPKFGEKSLTCCKTKEYLMKEMGLTLKDLFPTLYKMWMQSEHCDEHNIVYAFLNEIYQIQGVI